MILTTTDTNNVAAITIAGAIAEAAAVLRQAGIAEARREAGSLLSHALARDRTFLLTHADDALSPDDLARFRAFVSRRAAGEPLQYISGRQEFYGLEFEVTPAVLIPRPETELLVETALEHLSTNGAPLVCDVGTGSGCVAVALLNERANARAVAVDISPAALDVAARNAERHGVRARLALLAADGLTALDPRGARFTVIVSNPPYIAEEEIDELQREVRDHEPRSALTPGGDGLAMIRRLLADAPRFLGEGGHLIFEIGFDQHERVAALIDTCVWKLLDIRQDLQGIPRTVVLRRVRRLNRNRRQRDKSLTAKTQRH